MRRHVLPAAAIGAGKAMRLGATPAERRLWLALREGLPEASFQRQVAIGPYRVAFCSPSARLVVELVGPETETGWAEDEARILFLNGEGFRVLRFWSHEVLERLDNVLTAILCALPEPRNRVAAAQDRFVGPSEAGDGAIGAEPLAA